MAHIFRTVTLVFVLTATGATDVGVSLPSADSTRSGVDRSSRDIHSRARMTTPVVRTSADIEPLTDLEHTLVAWAKDLTVRFDSSRTLCDNNEGRYHHEPNGEKVVTICAPDSDTFAGQLQRRRTLLHEFGHAWDFANLSAQDHDELGRILGVDAWNDHDDEWANRGVEVFAETFVYALLDQPLRQLKVGLECTDLLGAFGAATDAEPLGPGLPPCAA
jgi:hypothetical protein